jgi:hypothetical protein
MRSAVIGFAAAFAIGLVALVAVGLGQRSSLVYSLGVNPALSAATLATGDRACQAPVRVPRGATFDRVGFLLRKVAEPGPPVRVEVHDAATNRRLASGRLPSGYADFDPARRREHVIAVGRVETDAPLRLCVVNEGRGSVSVIGQAGIASPPTSGTLSGEPIATDLTFNLRGGDRSLLALLPNIADRAARFRAGWVTPLVYLLLALAILVAAPLVLARAIARAASDDQRSAASTTRQ